MGFLFVFLSRTKKDISFRVKGLLKSLLEEQQAYHPYNKSHKTHTVHVCKCLINNNINNNILIKDLLISDLGQIVFQSTESEWGGL